MWSCLTCPIIRAYTCRGLGVLGSGAFLGMTANVSSVTLPVILQQREIGARQRVELWSSVYDLTVRRWVPVGLLSAAAYFAAAVLAKPNAKYNTKGVLLAAGVSMASIVPATATLVAPVVRKLKGFLQGSPSDAEAKDTLKSWGVWHYSRTLGAGVAFLLGITDLVMIAVNKGI